LDTKLCTRPFYADGNPHSKALYKTSAAAVGISFFLETETLSMPIQETLLFIFALIVKLIFIIITKMALRKSTKYLFL